jgi:hypothetical protein
VGTTHKCRRGLRAICAWSVCALAASACLDNKLDESETVAGKRVFIAQVDDFKDYADWMSFKNETADDHGGVLGTTTIYVNELPDEETHEFSVGTILFKATEVAGFDKPTIHAMAKRGSNFNPEGVIGWEYFELVLNKKGTPLILWRGAEPPNGEHYQMLLSAQNVDRPMMTGQDGDCNSCHAEGKDGMLGDDILKLLDE